MRSDRNAMMNPKPGEYARKMSFSQWHRQLGRKRNNKLELTHWRIVWSQSLVSSDFAGIHFKQRTQLLSLYLNQHLWWYFLSSSFNQLCPDGRQSQRCMLETAAIFAGLLFLFFFVVPGMPYDLRAYPVNSAVITVEWKRPINPNGKITNYTVK